MIGFFNLVIYEWIFFPDIPFTTKIEPVGCHFLLQLIFKNFNLLNSMQNIIGLKTVAWKNNKVIKLW